MPAIAGNSTALVRRRPQVEMAAHTERHSPLAESFRATFASMLFSSRNGCWPRAVVLTGASPGEGKTTLVSNLGITMAETNRKVLLIHAEMRVNLSSLIYSERSSELLCRFRLEYHAILIDTALVVRAGKTSSAGTPATAATGRCKTLARRRLPLWSNQAEYTSFYSSAFSGSMLPASAPEMRCAGKVTRLLPPYETPKGRRQTMVLRFSSAAFVGLCALVVSVTPASASVVIHDSLSTWQEHATQSGATVDFSAFAPTPGTSLSNQHSVAVDGATITSPNYFVSVHNPNASQWWYEWTDAGAILRSDKDTSGDVRLDLSNALTALAFDVMVGGDAVPSQVTIQVGNATVVLWTETVSTPARPDHAVAGIVSSDPFNWVTITPSANFAVIDNLRLGSMLTGGQNPPDPPDPEPTPEPWALFTAGGGLVVLGLRKYLWRGQAV